MNRKLTTTLARAILGLWTLAYALAPAYAITIEGQDPSGNLLSVGVDALGHLQVNPGGANATPYCAKPGFGNMTVSSTAISTLLSGSTARSQALFYNEGPDAVWISTVNSATVGTSTPGTWWFKVPKTGVFAFDTPASMVGTIYIINGGPHATSQEDTYTCGN